LLATADGVVPGSSHEVDQTAGNRYLMAEKLAAGLLFAVAGWYLTTRRPKSAWGPLVIFGAVANVLAVLAARWSVHTLVGGTLDPLPRQRSEVLYEAHTLLLLLVVMAAALAGGITRAVPRGPPQGPGRGPAATGGHPGAQRP
jgi:hypothetical protein